MHSETSLGNFTPTIFSFPRCEEEVNALAEREGKGENEREQIEAICHKLIHLIKQAPQEFLLPAVLEYMGYVRKYFSFSFAYRFSLFELWLNESATLNEKERGRIRGKIGGKWIPRGEYQRIFPIGMMQQYEGPHFVSAHRSPDVDTTIGSFWGWLDSFTISVGRGRHIWNLPKGALPGHIEAFFSSILGEQESKGIELIARREETLKLSAADLLTQSGLIKKRGEEKTREIMHEKGKNCIILVDDKGYYCGDWRNSDVEAVRWVIFLSMNSLYGLADRIQRQLILCLLYTSPSPRDS